VAGGPRPAREIGTMPRGVAVATSVAVVFVLNLPFGFWRAGTKRFTLPWFLAIHVPVPLAVALRIVAGVGLRLGTLPLFVGAFVAGQYVGGRCRILRRR